MRAGGGGVSDRQLPLQGLIVLEGLQPPELTVASCRFDDLLRIDSCENFVHLLLRPSKRIRFNVGMEINYIDHVNFCKQTFGTNLLMRVSTGQLCSKGLDLLIVRINHIRIRKHCKVLCFTRHPAYPVQQEQIHLQGECSIGRRLLSTYASFSTGLSALVSNQKASSLDDCLPRTASVLEAWLWTSQQHKLLLYTTNRNVCCTRLITPELQVYQEDSVSLLEQIALIDIP
ncbi:hypothetical protein J6590_017566 [Homalodisca vitripennis]|nr:hypothetical protein J6590_017566 [Homalodisca vitripennis]